MISGFPPIAGANARVLVLGTCPSRASLEAGEYYAHARNAFWPIMERLFAADERLDYSARQTMLLEARVALWDVLRTAERPTSLDADIVRSSEVANDIGGFLSAHSQVSTIFFNGATAETLFRRHIATHDISDSLRLVRLPSTSPANAAMTFETKFDAWSEVVQAARAGG